MTLNKAKFERAVEDAKAKAAGNKRWENAIDKAAKALIDGTWIVTELRNCLVITSASEKTYKVTEKICQCESFFHEKPCAHRAGARLINLYNKVADEPAASRPAPRITRSVERDPRSGARFQVTYCDGWAI
jgi:hypothetical protein